MACFVTNLSACVGGLTWVLLDYRHEKKYSALGFCAGAVAGLVYTIFLITIVNCSNYIINDY